MRCPRMVLATACIWSSGPSCVVTVCGTCVAWVAWWPNVKWSTDDYVRHPCQASPARTSSQMLGVSNTALIVSQLSVAKIGYINRYHATGDISRPNL